MIPKIARDPYLAEVARVWGEQAAFDAGFFEDDDPDDAPLADVGWLCTPTDVVRRGLATAPTAEGRSPVVLLSTGGFHPLHGGHLAMMAHARARAESAGWWVVGGYLSPGHDQYLRLKWGAAAPPASERIATLVAALGDVDWLAVDPWEALHRRVAVNYTDVTARLTAYLRHHLRPDIDVAFVCGADNARFALAFAPQGRAVVVGRPGAEADADRWRTDARVGAAPDRILWADGGHPGASSALPVAPRSARPHQVTVRLEDERAVATLGLAVPRWRAFQAALLAELAVRTAVRTVALADQVPAPVEGVVSLDPMLPGQVDLAVSRRFDLGGHQPLGHGPRPGHPPVEEQLRTIGPGPWTVRDDDRSTGGTIAFVTRLLDVAAVEVSLPEGDGEIADSRDLLLGTDDGGLVVVLPDGTDGRAPYLLPYVDPAARGTVPVTDAVAFSIAGWELNAAAFAGTGLTVADLPAPAAAVLHHAGYDPSAALEAVARAHATTLRSLLPTGRTAPGEGLLRPAGGRC